MAKKTTAARQVITARATELTDEIHALHDFAVGFARVAQMHLGHLLFELRQEFPDEASFVDFAVSEFNMAKTASLDYVRKYAGLRANPALIAAAEQSPAKALALTTQLTRRGATELPEADDLQLANLLTLPPGGMVKQIDGLLAQAPAAPAPANPPEPEGAEIEGKGQVIQLFNAGVLRQARLAIAAERAATLEFTSLSPAKRKSLITEVDKLYALLDEISRDLAAG